MIEPIIHDYLTQIFGKHYKLQPEPAAKEALRFLKITELYGMKLIIGEWTVPEPAPMVRDKPMSLWDKIAIDVKSVEDSGREPWLAREIQ